LVERYELVEDTCIGQNAQETVARVFHGEHPFGTHSGFQKDGSVVPGRTDHFFQLSAV